MGNANLNPDQTNTKRGGIVAIAAAALLRSYLVVGGNSGGRLTAGIPTALTSVALYVTDEAAASGANVPLTPITPDENVRIVAKGTGSAGDRLVLADPGTAADRGKVRAIPAAAGVYFSPGFAEEAFVDGQHVLVRPQPEIVRVASPDTLNGLTFSATVTQAEAQALRNAVRTILQTQGLMA